MDIALPAMTGFEAARPVPAAASSYEDGAVRMFTLAAVLWGVVGMTVGVLIAAQLTWPELNFGIPWLSYGRLRPLHTNAVIFAFGGCALMASSLYVVQRTSQVALFLPKLAWFVFWGWQVVIVAAAITLPLGYTRGKEYAELEWPIDDPDRRRLGRLRDRLLRHHRHPQGAPHLRRQLVLRLVHHRRRAAAHRQRRGDPGRLDEELLGLRRRAGRDGAVVVRPQRGRLLPDRGLPRDDVLLHPEAGRAADLFVPALDRALLGADLHLHVGGPAPPALHRAARLGAVGRAWCSRWCCSRRAGAA